MSKRIKKKINYQLLITQRIIWLLAKPFLLFFLPVKVSGLENIQKVKSKGLIIAMNHLSELDVIIMQASLPLCWKRSPVYYVTRESSFYADSFIKALIYNPIFFWIIGGRTAKVGLHDYSMSLEKHITLLKKGQTVCIFPEGGKSKDGNFKNAKGGIIALAKETEADILPVFAQGHFGLTIKDLLFRKKSVTISFGKPITSSEILEGSKEISVHEYEKITEEKIMAKLRRLQFLCNNSDLCE